MTDTIPACRRAVTRDDIEACLAIRDVVFVDEQGVDPEIERDGLDDESIHYLAEMDGRAIAAARVRVLPGKFKIQRVAVRKEARGKRIGDALMRFLMADLAAGGEAEGREFFLSSQSYAIPFYERLGFRVCSDEYMEAGIAHRDMRADVERA